MLTEREKIAHVCRRLGFGVGIDELDRYEKIGLQATIADLCDFEKPPTTYPIHPLEFFFQKNGDLQAQPQRVTQWWMTRMALTDRPSRDKLILFMHDHFAVSAQKVENGFLMLMHLQTLEGMLGMPFDQMLETIAVDPAMLVWLDMRTSIKGAPNENFARELMELFSIGIGNYTEKDVKETARALTGWGLRNISAERGRQGQAGQKEAAIEWAHTGQPLIASCYSKDLADPGPHEILGKTQSFNLNSICERLAKEPAAAKRLSKKLWEYYAYPDPEPKVIEHLASVYRKHDGKLTAVVAEIVKMKEFWSDRAIRAIVKSPVDYIVGITRQVIDPKLALADRDPNADVSTPLPDSTRNLGNSLAFLCNKMGMLPLYPPNVSGWNWGSAWVTSATMIDRINAASVFAGGGRGRSLSLKVQSQAQSRGLKTNAEITSLICQILDVPLTAEVSEQLEQLGSQLDFAGKMGNINNLSNALLPFVKTVFAIPNFQFC